MVPPPTPGGRLGRLARALVLVGPHAGAHRVALRAGLSILVPLLALWASGHLDWAIYAAFAATASLYGRDRGRLPRLRMQTQLGVLLTLATVGGVVVGTFEHRTWLAVPLAALLASGAALLSDLQDWHPPGALFLVFAFTACASIPAEAGDVPVAFGVAAVTAAFAVAVGSAGAYWRRHRGGGLDDASRPPGRPPALAESLGRHALPGGLAVLVAGSIATAVGIGHPYWAMVSAVVPFAARGFLAQLTRGLQRVVGTFAGLALVALIFALDPGGLALILLITALQVGAELLVGRNYAMALVCITPLALLTIFLVAGGDPAALIRDRGIETVIGVAVGLLVGYLTRPGVVVPRASRRVR